MPNHIKRVYSFRITADEINQIMGCRPDKLTDSTIEFINNEISNQMDGYRNNILAGITHAKNERIKHINRIRMFEKAVEEHNSKQQSQAKLDE